MEEDQRTLAENNENSVSQFGHLTHAEPKGPQATEAFEEVLASGIGS
jgi:hypothetical protein